MQMEIEYSIQQAISREIIFEIAINIENHYQFIKFVNESGKQQSKITQYYGQKEADLTNSLIRKVTLHNQYVPIETQFYHIQVHKQFIPNLCGYHATYNLIQAIQSLKYQIEPQLQNVASFWSYVKRTHDFLKEYRKKTRQDQSIWPWRDEDIDKGDFERTYWKACIEYKPLFKVTFSDETIDNIQYKVSCDSIFYQYGNIINSYPERFILQERFDQFINFKPTKDKQLIQAYMLGVTNHWIALLAHKSIKGTRFIVMDSRNRDYFLWNELQMRAFLDQDNIERPQRGQPLMNQFYLDLYTQCMKDIQKLCTLMVSWLSGQSKIEDYCSNQRLKVFLDPLLELLEMNQEQFINLKYRTELQPFIALWTEQYRLTIYQILSTPITGIEQVNKVIFFKAHELLKFADQIGTQTKQPIRNIQQILNIFSQIQNKF